MKWRHISTFPDEARQLFPSFFCWCKQQWPDTVLNCQLAPEITETFPLHGWNVIDKVGGNHGRPGLARLVHSRRSEIRSEVLLTPALLCPINTQSHPKPPTRGISSLSLCLWHKRAGIINQPEHNLDRSRPIRVAQSTHHSWPGGPRHRGAVWCSGRWCWAWEPRSGGTPRWSSSWWSWGKYFITVKLSTNESAVMKELDQWEQSLDKSHLIRPRGSCCLSSGRSSPPSCNIKIQPIRAKSHWFSTNESGPVCWLPVCAWGWWSLGQSRTPWRPVCTRILSFPISSKLGKTTFFEVFQIYFGMIFPKIKGVLTEQSLTHSYCSALNTIKWKKDDKNILKITLYQ